MYFNNNHIGKMLIKDPEMFWYFVPKAGVRVTYAKFMKKKLRSELYAGHRVKTQEQANEILTNMILSDRPFMFGRHGSNELLCAGSGMMVQRGITREIHRENLKIACFHSGLYPNTTETMTRFHDLIVMASQQTDLYGTFRMIWEDYYIKKFMRREVTLTHLNMLDFWRYEKPFTSALKGKKVLVVHPLAKQIEEQYKKRELLFENPEVLPEFELHTLKAVQTVAGEQDERASTWFDGLDYMYNEAMKIDFDIAILGCGAYGMPLAGMIKKAGRSVIYMGGVTQMLFGIRGGRWDSDPVANKLYNEHWVSPEAASVPKRASEVEDGCYW